MSKSSLLLLACSLVVGCSSAGGGEPAATDDAGTADSGSIDRDGASDTALAADTGGAIDSATTTDTGIDAAPINEPLFELVLGGVAITPTAITTEKVGTFSTKDPTVTGITRFKATLPKGTTDRDAPYVDFEVYTPKLGAIPYSPPGTTSQPGSAYLQYHYSRPGVSGFPKAEGPGMTIVRDGRDGWLEATGSGTFEIDDASVSFTLKIREPVPKSS